MLLHFQPVRSDSSERKEKDGRRSRCAVGSLNSKEPQEKVWAAVRKYNGINVSSFIIQFIAIAFHVLFLIVTPFRFC